MRFAILGQTVADTGAGPVIVESRSQQIVLAALLLNAPSAVSAEALIAAVWPGPAPASAAESLRNHIARLRRLLGPAASRLVPRSRGYLIDLDGAAFDVHEFRGHCRDGRELAQSGRWAEASAAFGSAEALWGGEPLAGLDPGAAVAAHVHRLSEEYLDALTGRIDADLMLGRHRVLVGELRDLAARLPLHEPVHHRLMLALYRCARQAEALDVFHSLRATLAEDLAVEPGSEIQDLYQRILRQDPGLRQDPVSSSEEQIAMVSLSVVRPSELPADPADFTGRDRETDLIRRLLAGSGGGDGPLALVAISGPGGIGKTALAVHAGRRLIGEFPDGELFAHLGGAHQEPVAPADVLLGFLRSLGVPADEAPTDGAGRSALFRSLTAGRRLLIVLDDVADAAQVRPLLPGSGSCAVLLTARRRLPELAGAHHLDLDILPPDDAAALVARIAGRRESAAESGPESQSGPESESEAIRDLAAACGRFPLALRIAGARLATRPAWTAGDLVELLGTGRQRLDELVAGDLEVRATFDVSYRGLAAAQARAFRLLSVGGLEEIAVPGAAAVLDLPDGQARRLAEALVDASLLMPSTAGRYRYHDLIRLFAQEAAAAGESGDDRVKALARLVTFYRWRVENAVEVIRRGPPDMPDADPGKALFAGPQQARRWLDEELRNVTNLVVDALRQPDLPTDEPLAIIKAVQSFLRSSGAWDSSMRMSRAALARATADADPAAELTARQYLGMIAVLTGEPAEAQTHLTQALELARTLDDRSAQAAALNRLGLLSFTRNEIPASIDSHQAALDIFRDLDDRAGMCTTMINLGKTLSEAGRGAQALSLIEQSLALATAAADDVSIAFAEYTLARCYLTMQRYDEAIAVYQASLPKLRERGLREGEAHTVAELGQTLLEAGRPEEALAHLQNGIALMRTLGDRHSAATHAVEAGRAHRALGEEAEALRLWREALEVLTITSPSQVAGIQELIDQSPLASL